MRTKNLLNKFYEYRQLAWPAAVVIFSFLLFEKIHLLEPYFNGFVSESAYLSWHTMFEFISILVSFSVFILPYYSYRQNRRLKGIFIANIFLIMGIIDIFHTLSFRGMPFFLIENNTANRATTFWILSRLTGALGITASGFIRINKKSLIDRRLFTAISISFSVIVLILVSYYPQFLPAMYIEGLGVTPVKKLLEYLIMFIFSFAGMMYLKQFLKSKDSTNLLYIVAITVSIISEIAFVKYVSVYDIHNYLGHVYKIISYFLVFKIAFDNYIEKPYLALYAAKNKVKAYAGKLNRLVEERTRELYSSNQKLLEDLEYARDIQKAILPDKLPNCDQVSFEAKYYPAERVGGDFYNIFRLDDNRIGMYIGDVSGHGVPAAMLTVYINQSIKTIRELEGSRFEVINPSKVLKSLYEMYNKVNFKDELYILLLYAIYDIKTGELIYSSAGLNTQPLIIKNNNDISELDIKGFPICNLADICPADYTDKKITLEKGDKVFFYTDGLTELNRNENTYAMEHLKKLLSEHEAKGNTGFYNEIDRKVKSISEKNGLKDDVTFFMLKVG